MLKLGSRKGIGTPVRCPSCRYPNLAIDIWCERCGTPLDWQRSQVRPFEPAEPTPVQTEPAVAPIQDEQGIAPILRPTPRPEKSRRTWSFPKLTLPAFDVSRIQLPRWRPPHWRGAVARLRLRFPVIPRTVGIVAVVVAVLLLVPLAYLLLPGGRSVASRQTQLPATSATKPPADSPQAAAISGVQAKTGLTYATNCTGARPCLSLTGQTLGQAAGAFVFSTAATGGRECAAYVVQSGGKWRLLGTACGLPGQVTPLVGRDATVHVPGNCANVRDAASLQATAVTCLHDGTTVRIDRGPVYADGFMWWHLSQGWMAHDFLAAP